MSEVREIEVLRNDNPNEYIEIDLTEVGQYLVLTKEKVMRHAGSNMLKGRNAESNYKRLCIVQSRIMTCTSPDCNVRKSTIVAELLRTVNERWEGINSNKWARLKLSPHLIPLYMDAIEIVSRRDYRMEDMKIVGVELTAFMIYFFKVKFNYNSLMKHFPTCDFDYVTPLETGLGGGLGMHVMKYSPSGLLASIAVGAVLIYFTGGIGLIDRKSVV